MDEVFCGNYSITNTRVENGYVAVINDDEFKDEQFFDEFKEDAVMKAVRRLHEVKGDKL